MQRDNIRDNDTGNDGHGSSHALLAADQRKDISISIINWRAMRWVKIISILVIGTFLFQQVAWAADYNISTILLWKKAQSQAIKDDGLSDKLEVTNYDLMNDRLKRKPSKASGMSSALLEKLQAEREQEMKRRNELEDASLEKQMGDMEGDFDKALQILRAKKRKKFLDDEEPRGGRRRPLAGGQINFTLSDFNEEGDPQTLNVYNYDDNGKLVDIVSYDISELDAKKWLDAGREIDGKEGDKFFGGFMDDAAEGLEEYITSKTVYKGEKDEEIVDYVLSDFYEGKAYQISYYDYDKDDDDALDEVRTYSLDDIDEEIEGNSEGSEWLDLLSEDELTNTAVFEGEKSEERIVYTLDDYAINDN